MTPSLVNTTLLTYGKKPEQIVGFSQCTRHKQLGEPEDIANLIAGLCSGDCIWINGQTVLPIVG